ncbi:hypothetical protein [Nocardia sp. NPDC060259]|uniref:hypothetical protein n=1 Tax=Nocardia sp. NPDC060259 TaxID=3347088 RepID=UPI00364A5D4A
MLRWPLKARRGRWTAELTRRAMGRPAELAGSALLRVTDGTELARCAVGWSATELAGGTHRRLAELTRHALAWPAAQTELARCAQGRLADGILVRGAMRRLSALVEWRLIRRRACETVERDRGRRALGRWESRLCGSTGGSARQRVELPESWRRLRLPEIGILCSPMTWRTLRLAVALRRSAERGRWRHKGLSRCRSAVTSRRLTEPVYR